MKNSIYLFLLFTQVFWAQSDFDKGNEYYRKNNFEAAAKSYEVVLKGGNESVELYYNLGNAYYKLNKIAPAIYNYEKALLINPNDKDVLNNLKFAQNRRVDDIKIIPEVGFDKLIHSFTAMVHYNTWGWIAVILSVLFLLCFIGYYFTRTTIAKRLFFTGMLTVFIFILLSIGAAVFEKRDFNSEQPAIVFAEEIAVKNEPNSSGSNAFTLHEGTKIYLIETIDDWSKIKLEDGSEGWITTSSIKKLKI